MMVKLISTLILTLTLVVANVSAESFVSFKGDFYIEIPESWERVDYQTADYYLSHGDVDVELDYEAAFVERAALTLFRGQYLVVTVDTIGQLDESQIDSILNSMKTEFDRPVEAVSSEAFMAEPMPEVILYSAEDSLIAVETEVPGDDLGPRTTLMVMRLYDKGIANFFFYAPAQEYAASLGLYRDIVTSFSTEDVATALKKEPAKVADLERDSGSGTGRYVALYGGILVILLAILIARARSRKQKSNE